MTIDHPEAETRSHHLEDHPIHSPAPDPAPPSPNRLPLPLTRRRALYIFGLSAVALVVAGLGFGARDQFSSAPHGSQHTTSQGAVLLKLRPVEGMEPVFIGKHEVSIAEMLEYYRSSGQRPDLVVAWSNPARWEEPATATYLEAVSFLAWLTEREHASNKLPKDYVYTLVSDMEWTLAAGGVPEDRALDPKGRAAKPRDAIYVWGTDKPDAPGNVNVLHKDDVPGATAGFPGSDRSPGVAPVNHLDINSQGYVGMCGNLSEWVGDAYEGSDLNPAAPRTIRGANWQTTSPDECRLAYRRSATPDLSGESAKLSPVVGFRIALRARPAPKLAL